MNLDDKVTQWHADATLSPTLRARLSQVAPPSKRHRPTLALRYGLAACVGVSLGVGFVAYKNRSHRKQTQTLSQGMKSDKAPSNETFQKVADTIKFWREPDEQAAKKKQRYEAILFTDLDCPSCKKAYPLLKKATSLRLGICQMPLTGIHPEALGKAIQAEADSPDGFWKQMSDGHAGVFIEEQDASVEDLKQAKRRVAAMRVAAQSAGVAETPTLWVREGASADGANPKGFWVAIGADGIKTVLEKLQ